MEKRTEVRDAKEKLIEVVYTDPSGGKKVFAPPKDEGELAGVVKAIDTVVLGADHSHGPLIRTEK